MNNKMEYIIWIEIGYKIVYGEIISLYLYIYIYLVNIARGVVKNNLFVKRICNLSIKKFLILYKNRL